MFVNRLAEKKELGKVLDSKTFEFMILYGRRRVGKTTLVLEILKKREHIYYLAIEKNNIQHFVSTAAKKYPEIRNLKEDWEIILDFLKDKSEVVVIDEFQNLIKEDHKILSLFQRIIDTNLKQSSLKLIIMGSSVSMITSEVLGYKSPLYGRKTYSNKIRPMSYFDMAGFFPKANAEQLAEIFGFADGIPYYLEKIDIPFWKWLDRELKESSFLKDELNFILRYEFEDLGTYKTILEAIANGKNTVAEIKDFARLQRTDVSPYLVKLANTEFIDREVPITERLISKKGRYYIKDEFVAFWFRFVFTNRSSIEEGVYPASSIKDQYCQYMGFVFEKICKQFLFELQRSGEIQYDKVGRWWHRDVEIDLVALQEKRREALFCECKWADAVDAHSILKSLKEKIGHVEWNKGKRKEKFVIFAKSFKGKTALGADVVLYELKDIAKCLR
jgi:AAA+ ATPase superfamily predicted ATPase